MELIPSPRYDEIVSSKKSRDLGSGVRFATLADGNRLVRSEWLRLPWSVRAGNVTGTAVLVGDEALEVVACQRSGSTESWTLEPWPHDQAMRGVVTLDEAWLVRLAREVAVERRSGRLRRWSLPVAPLLGSAPAVLQSAWASRWGFPAAAATTMSALGELLVAAVGIIHVLSSAFGGSGVLPPWLAWLGLLAPALAIEAMVRLKHVMAVREPIGTALLLPLSVLQPRENISKTPTAPAVRALDQDRGTLQVWSPIYRADWEPGGLLSYREALYSLSSIEREGRDWIYNFAQPDDGAVGPALRLRPPAQPIVIADARASTGRAPHRSCDRGRLPRTV